MSRSASWDAVRVGKGWPESGYGNHHSFLQKQKMHLILLSPQLPPPPAHPTPPAPQASQRQRPWRKLLTVHPDTEPRQALATALPSSGGGVCGQYQLDPETEGTSQSSLVATGTKVVTLNVFAEKKRKYKIDLVLQMSFPQRLQHGTPGILKKKPH